MIKLTLRTNAPTQKPGHSLDQVSPSSIQVYNLSITDGCVSDHFPVIFDALLHLFHTKLLSAFLIHCVLL